MNSFNVIDLPLFGLKRLQRMRLGDDRGFFSRLYCSKGLASAGWVKQIAQINHTFTTKRGSVRGMHYQYPPHAEMKLVSCLRGEVWDVAVDLRRGSPTFLHWHAEVLSANNNFALIIPEGYAHGFQTLSDDCELIYFHTSNYCKEAEGGLHVQDPHLNIHWPLPIAELSQRDAEHPWIGDEYQGIEA